MVRKVTLNTCYEPEAMLYQTLYTVINLILETALLLESTAVSQMIKFNLRDGKRHD